MAFNMVDLITAIKTRLEASNDSTFRGGLVYPLRAPPDLSPAVGSLPDVTLNLSWDGDDPLQSDGMAAQLYFTADAPQSRFFTSWDLDLVFDVLQVSEQGTARQGVFVQLNQALSWCVATHTLPATPPLAARA